MNNRGQFFLTFMLAIVVIVLALAFAPVLNVFVNDATDSNNLDCTNTSISIFDKTTCIITDVSPFGFIVGLIVLAGGLIGARIILK